NLRPRPKLVTILTLVHVLYTGGTRTMATLPSTIVEPLLPDTETEVHPDVDLVARTRAGDNSAYEQLVKQYERQIFRTANHITQNREDAEDITQDVFFKAFQKLDQFKGDSKFSHGWYESRSTRA